MENQQLAPSIHATLAEEGALRGTSMMKMTKIFLSYSRADESHAHRLYKSLCERGLDVWFDKESLLPGQVWEEVIRAEIAASDFVMLLLSKTSVGRRGFFIKELRLALDVLDTIPLGHVYIFPVRLEDCEIPAQLKTIHCVDLFPEWDRCLMKLGKAIELQMGIQSRAKTIEADDTQSQEVRLLLVNDQPATMNFAGDLWKGCGISVDYAFDVPQAIRSIERSSYSVIVSDLSHFSPSGLVTNRAAFEILEWARDKNKAIKLIISTGDITEERKQLARDLGAVGICNTLKELNKLMTQATGHQVELPPDFAAADVAPEGVRADSGVGDQAAGRRCLAYVCHSQADDTFVQRLANDLKQFGVVCSHDLPSFATGDTWERPTTRLISEANVMLAIVSGRSGEDRRFERELYEGIAKERRGNERFVIPVVLDDDAVKKMPYFLESLMYVDFRGDYRLALTQLVAALNQRRSEGEG